MTKERSPEFNRGIFADEKTGNGTFDAGWQPGDHDPILSVCMQNQTRIIQDWLNLKHQI